jgi:protein-S-isoprenylcysteine O-methyltransferase Ste14
MGTRQQALIVVPLIICILTCTFGVLGYFMGIVIGLPGRLSIPPLFRGVGIIVLTIGLLLMGWLFRYRKPTDIITSTYLTMRKAVKGTQPEDTCIRTESLILQGPQRHVRHPMYFAVVMLLFGWWLTLGYTFLLFMAFFFFLWFNLVVIRFEEKELRSFFGDEYEAYVKEVPRFFPSWTHRLH